MAILKGVYLDKMTYFRAEFQSNKHVHINEKRL